MVHLFVSFSLSSFWNSNPRNCILKQRATVPQRIPGKLATYIYLEGNFRDLSLQVKKRFSQLHKFWHNPTLYVSFPGCFIKGESWLMDQNVRFCAKGTRAVLCRKLKEGLRAMICTAVSKPSQERCRKSSLRNWSQVASQGSFYQRKDRGWVVGRGVFPNLQCCLYEEGGVGFLCTDVSFHSLNVSGSKFWASKLKTLEKGAYLRKHFMM